MPGQWRWLTIKRGKRYFPGNSGYDTCFFLTLNGVLMIRVCNDGMVRLMGLIGGMTDPGTDTQPATVATLKPAKATQQRDRTWSGRKRLCAHKPLACTIQASSTEYPRTSTYLTMLRGRGDVMIKKSAIVPHRPTGQAMAYRLKVSSSWASKTGFRMLWLVFTSKS